MNSKAAQQVQVPLHRMARPGIFMRPGGRVREGESPKDALGEMAVNARVGPGSQTNAKHYDQCWAPRPVSWLNQEVIVFSVESP